GEPAAVEADLVYAVVAVAVAASAGGRCRSEAGEKSFGPIEQLDRDHRLTLCEGEVGREGGRFARTADPASGGHGTIAPALPGDARRPPTLADDSGYDHDPGVCKGRVARQGRKCFEHVGDL